MKIEHLIIIESLPSNWILLSTEQTNAEISYIYNAPSIEKCIVTLTLYTNKKFFLVNGKYVEKEASLTTNIYSSPLYFFDGNFVFRFITKGNWLSIWPESFKFQTMYPLAIGWGAGIVNEN